MLFIENNGGVWEAPAAIDLLFTEQCGDGSYCKKKKIDLQFLVAVNKFTM